MNAGLAIFKKRQRLQGGTENVYHRDELFFRPGHTPSSKEASRLYDPGEQSDEDYNAAYEARERALDPTYGTPQHRMGPRDVYKTVTMNIGGQEMEVPAVFDNMTDIERNLIQSDLPPNQWPKEILEKIENTARDNLEQGMDVFGNRADEGDARGTSNVGLNLFRRKQMLKKPKP